MVYKIIKKSILYAFIAVSIGFFSGKAYLLHKKKRKLDAIVTLSHRQIFVITLSDNDKVIQSALNQEYDNFRIINLPNQEFSLKNLKNFLHKNEKLLNNLKRQNSESIVVLIDDNHWFAHDQVLSRINKVYNEKNALALTCKELIYPSYSLKDQSKNIDEWELRCFTLKAFLETESNIESHEIVNIEDVLFFNVEQSFKYVE